MQYFLNTRGRHLEDKRFIPIEDKVTVLELLSNQKLFIVAFWPLEVIQRLSLTRYRLAYLSIRRGEGVWGVEILS